jgi:prevent-host-death family protein
MKIRPLPSASYAQPEPAAGAIEEAAAAFGVRCEVVNVRQARDRLSSLLDRAADGEQIVITSDGRPKAMIVRFRPMIHGPKWISMRALRQSMPLAPDSAPLVRKLRDDGY